MNRQRLRTYADTSVFGGVFDPGFAEASTPFFGLVRADLHQLVISPLVADELKDAPPPVRSFFDEMLPLAELIPVWPEAVELQEAYLQANIVTSQWAKDALHVAFGLGIRLRSDRQLEFWTYRSLPKDPAL